jgi:FkbM family methyltransferase
MKIFIDVGAHEGETLLSVLDPKYSFDKIFVFEPVEKLHAKLNKIAAQRKNVNLLKYGLWNKNTTQKIYSPGTVAGSLFAAHQDVDKNDFELCEFVNASEWFDKNIGNQDEVYVKLNCEGAEADILLDLLKSKEIFKIKDVMIDFDVRKVKGLENTRQDVLDEFKKAGFTSYSLCEDVMTGPSSITRIQNWLDTAGANKTDIKSQIKQSFYWIKMVILNKRPGYYWEFKHFIKFYTPLFLLKLIGARRN